jgi:hypothetical protein
LTQNCNIEEPWHGDGRFPFAGALVAVMLAPLATPALAKAPPPYVIARADGGAVLRGNPGRILPRRHAGWHQPADGRTQPAAPVPPRPSTSGAAAERPSAFPLRVCEIALPRGTKQASVRAMRCAPCPRWCVASCWWAIPVVG